jgi:phosphatidylglycerophosphate synthase
MSSRLDQSAQPLSRRMAPGAFAASPHTLLAVVTLARLAIVPVVIASFMTEPLVTTIALIAFVVADVYDGVLARRYDTDDADRRALDSIVDRLTIDLCLVGAFFAGALPLVLLLALLARDLYCSAICGVMMRERRVAIKADWLYRALNVSVAAWAITAPFVSQSLRTTLAALLVAASIIVAVDLTRSVRRVLTAPQRIRNLVVGAGALRSRRFSWNQL